VKMISIGEAEVSSILFVTCNSIHFKIFVNQN
jgi:hypothetical protein